MLGRIEFSIETEARNLAACKAEADPGIIEIWWFPDGAEIRLIEVGPALPSSGQVTPYCSPPDAGAGVHYPTAVARIRPEDRSLPLPRGWVGWDKAVELL